MCKSVADHDSSLEEQEHASNVLAGLLRVREFAWFQYKNGILDEAALRSYLAPLSRWFQRGDTMTVWREFSREFDPEFVAYVEADATRLPAKAAVGDLSFHFAPFLVDRAAVRRLDL